MRRVLCCKTKKEDKRPQKCYDINNHKTHNERGIYLHKNIVQESRFRQRVVKYSQIYVVTETGISSADQLRLAIFLQMNFFRLTYTIKFAINPAVMPDI